MGYEPFLPPRCTDAPLPRPTRTACPGGICSPRSPRTSHPSALNAGEHRPRPVSSTSTSNLTSSPSAGHWFTPWPALPPSPAQRAWDLCLALTLISPSSVLLASHIHKQSSQPDGRPLTPDIHIHPESCCARWPPPVCTAPGRAPASPAGPATALLCPLPASHSPLLPNHLLSPCPHSTDHQLPCAAFTRG